MELDLENVTTPGGLGARMYVRPGTSDLATVGAIFGLWTQEPGDEYGFAEGPVSGLALDIGAHIGTATVALLIDNPDLRVVAVEALPENADMVRRNVETNHLADRATVIAGAASNSTSPVPIAYGSRATEFAAAHYFIGGGVWHDEPDATIIEQPPVSLTSLVDAYGPVSLCKIDCEGGEWSFLDDPAVAKVAEFRGEWHARGGHGLPRLHELLDPTHVVEAEDREGYGPFRAVRRYEPDSDLGSIA